MTLGKSSNINNPISIAINTIPPNPMNCELRRSSSAHVLVLMYAEVSFLSTVSSRFIRAKTSSNDKVEFVSHGQKQVSVEYCGDAERQLKLFKMLIDYNLRFSMNYDITKKCNLSLNYKHNKYPVQQFIEQFFYILPYTVLQH